MTRQFGRLWDRARQLSIKVEPLAMSVGVNLITMAMAKLTAAVTPV